MPDYEPYIAKVHIDWRRLETVDSALGNAPGIYPDVAMLLEQTVRLPNIRSIVEFGSGASTVYLFAAAQLLGTPARTFEEEPRWRDVTQSLLREMGVAGTVELYQDFDPSLRPDAIFLDCHGALRQALPNLYPAVFTGCKVLLVDDTETEWARRPYMEFLDQHKRINNYFFNPTGRDDRTVLINVLDQDFDIVGWVHSWLPV